MINGARMDRETPAHVQPSLPRSATMVRDDAALITGGAGFIGSNLADRLLSSGWQVTICDNLSVYGSRYNLSWLRLRHGEQFRFRQVDTADWRWLRAAASHADVIYDLSSDIAPDNAGIDAVVNAIRRQKVRPALVLVSRQQHDDTHDALPLLRHATRFEPEDPLVAKMGLDEIRTVQHGSPTAALERHVLEAGQCHDFAATVLRLNHVYGPHQHGYGEWTWLSHFVAQTLLGLPVTLSDDGLAVCDALHVNDLVDALLLAYRHRATVAGGIFNVGGGSANSLSRCEMVAYLGDLYGERPTVLRRHSGPDSPRYCVGDIRRFGEKTGWSPAVDVVQGMALLYERWVEHFALLAKNAPPPARQEAFGARPMATARPLPVVP